MSGSELPALPILITPTTSSVAISDGHEIDAVHDNVDLVDVHSIELSADPSSRKRALSYVSDESDVDAVLKKRRGRPAKSAKSAPFHARKPRVRKQKDGEKKTIDAVVDDTDIHAMIDIGVQTDACELNVLSSSTAALSDSISKSIKQAIDPVTTELQFTTIDIKELLVTLHQLSSQVQLLSAAVASLSVKKPSTTQSQSDSDSESSDSDIVEGIAGDWKQVTRGLKKRRKHNASASQTHSVQHCDPPQTHDNAEKNFMASMYRDLELKEHRSKNIILSGMPYSHVVDDFTMATNMLAEEFDLHYIPTVSCRRLGRLIDGRRQLLLVTMETRQDADYFIANAKYLRHSQDPEVRDHVYISADLTPAESKAAYDS